MISIAMATYNGSRYIRAQLESFASQTLPPDELVVCDDCSSDNTIDIIEEFSRMAPFSIRIIRNEKRLGYVRNFEKALSLCQGDIIFLSDQDDVWFPTKLNYVRNVFSNNPKVQVVANNCEFVDDNLRSYGATLLGNMRKMRLRDDTLVKGCCTSLRKEWADYVLPFPEGISSYEHWIHGPAICKGIKLIVNASLQCHRRHDNNTSNAVVDSLKYSWLVKSYLDDVLRDVSQRWQANLRDRLKIRERLMDRPMPGEPSKEEIEAAVRHIDREIALLQHRLRLSSMARVRRLPLVLRLLAMGSYSAARGWKSAARDLIAPCAAWDDPSPSAARKGC